MLLRCGVLIVCPPERDGMSKKWGGREKTRRSIQHNTELYRLTVAHSGNTAACFGWEEGHQQALRLRAHHSETSGKESTTQVWLEETVETQTREVWGTCSSGLRMIWLSNFNGICRLFSLTLKILKTQPQHEHAVSRRGFVCFPVSSLYLRLSLCFFSSVGRRWCPALELTTCRIHTQNKHGA